MYLLVLFLFLFLLKYYYYMTNPLYRMGSEFSISDVRLPSEKLAGQHFLFT